MLNDIGKTISFFIASVLTVAFLSGCREGEDTLVEKNGSVGNPGSGAVVDVLIREFHEAIVIGSGYGGSVSALRLGEAGIETLVLEKGRRWTVTEPTVKAGTFATEDTILEGFLDGIGADVRAVWLGEECHGNAFFVGLPFKLLCGKDTGVLEQVGPKVNPYDLSPAVKINGVAAWNGVGVGGGSLVNNGITYRPLRESWELAYDLQSMPLMEEIWQDLTETYFARVETFLRPSPIPQDILESPYYQSTQIHIETMLAAGYPFTNNADGNQTHGSQLLPMIIDWDVVREELNGQKAPSVIDGEAWYGINSGAKRSLDTAESYLGMASATGKVTIKPLHTVTAIRYEQKTDLYVVSVSETDEDYNIVARYEFSTPSLIVSAGSIGTTKLMMAAKHQGGLPNLNEHVGTKWSNNGNTFTLRSGSDKRITQGGPAGIKSTNLDDPSAPLVIENLSQKAARVLEINDETSDIASPVLGSILTIAVGVPEKEGVFTWDEATKSVNLDWPVDGSKNIYDRFFQVMDELAPYGKALPLKIEQAQQFTLHPLGGMPIGLATNKFCAVENYTGLYAIDGSIIPGSSALANPSLLISSLAERCIEHAMSNIQNRKHIGRF
ncbi:MAG: GMC family oxidoreductase N-terminal domain-containing protein [Pseudomonadota bacterium]